MSRIDEASTKARSDRESVRSSDIIVGGNYRILPDSPLSEYSRPGAPAYVAQDDRKVGRPLFANVCEPGVLPRVDTLVQLRTLREADIIRPVAWDPVPWPRAGQRCFAVVYEHPEEPPVMSSLRDRMPSASTEFLVASVLTPLSQTLALLARRGQTHRAISPDNMYRTGATGETVILGDCVTSPPGWAQRALLEPIEVGMTPPVGRGPGTFADDIYALGATMLFLALGWCPVVDLSDDEIIEAKTHKGSFMALLNGERPPVGMREPLRGMLNDDPNERWTLDDIEQWIGGVMRRSAQPSRHPRTDRAYEFKGVEHRNCRTLADSFGKNRAEAIKAIRSKEFEAWVMRGLSDAALMDRINEVLTYTASQFKDAADEIAVSKVCAVLDPQAPLRYKGVCATTMGLGATLAEAIQRDDRDTVQAIGDTIAKGLPGEWLKRRSLATGADYSNQDKLFRRLQQFLKLTTPGYGIERVLYETNPFVPCQSDMLKRDYVYSLRDLIPSLEQLVRERGELPSLVDRHIAAFIAARLKHSTETILAMIEDGRSDSLSSNLAMLKLLAEVQKDHGPDTAPNLVGWLGQLLAPAIEQFESRATREELTRKLDNVIAKGSLPALHGHLNSKERIKRDQVAKKQAAREFAEAAAKIEQLISKEFQEDALRTGWGIAAGGSMILAITTVAILAVW